jgi:hypothetical protein
MNTTQQDKPIKKSMWQRWPFWATVIPLTLLLAFLIVFVVHEKRAQDRLNSELAHIRTSDDPVDDATMSQWFLARTSQEGTSAWREILHLTDASLAAFGQAGFKRIPYVGEAPVPAEIRPGDEWPEEQDVAEYLRWMQPVLQQIEEASHYPTPVWQPIECRGFETLLPELQNSRSLTRLLSVEVEHALYHGDAERALRGLESMRAVTTAFDWELVLVTELVQIALRQVHQGMIRRSLGIDIWNEEQLLALQEQLGPARDVPTMWRRVFAGERAMMIAGLQNPQALGHGSEEASSIGMISRVPSLREPVILAYEKLQSVGGEGLVGLPGRVTKTLETFATATNPLLGLLLPAVTAFAVAIENEETSRRFSRTAVAIKSFQLKHGQWPDQLSELSQVGLSANDWNTVSGGTFGYEIDGAEAILWSYSKHDEPRVRSTRPGIGADAKKNDSDIVVTIR